MPHFRKDGIPKPHVNKRAKATYVLIAICILVFILENYLYMTSDSAFMDSIFENYGFSLQGVLDGNFWSFITAIFMHANPEHLIFNMLALFFFGTVVEEECGWKRLLLIFFLSAIVGDIAVMTGSYMGIMPADVPTVGASAAIFGLLGYAMIADPLHIVFYPYLVPVPVVLVAVLYSVYNALEFIAVIGLGASSQVAYIAHFGGLLLGMLIGFREESEKKGLIAVGLIILIMIVLPFVWNYIQMLEETNYLAVFTESFS